MKRILLAVVIVCGLSAAAVAQSGKMTQNKVTATNADTIYLTPNIVNPADHSAFQLNVLKVSGTVAGSAVLNCSEDGTNWFAVPGADTLTLTNASNFKRWQLGAVNSKMYRIKLITSGTQVSTPTAYFWAK